MAKRWRTHRRDFDIWFEYSQGEKTQAKLAEEYGIHVDTVNAIVRRMRAQIPVEERQARQRQALDDLSTMRDELFDIVEAPAPPAYSNGYPMVDAKGNPVEDHGGRVQAMAMVLKIQERQAKAIGTDAPIEVNVNVREQEEAERVAAQAAARLASGE
jgi:DNA-binding CsgD family transcriptional regulator